MQLMLLFRGASTCSDSTERITLQCSGIIHLFWLSVTHTDTHGHICDDMNARLEEMIDRGSTHFKYCSRSNVNLSAWKRGWGSLNRNLTVRFCEGSRPGGLLFSHLPLNDLDAILTARTTRRTLSIPHIRSLLANPVGRRGTARNKSGIWRGEMTRFTDPLSHPWRLMKENPIGTNVPHTRCSEMFISSWSAVDDGCHDVLCYS